MSLETVGSWPTDPLTSREREILLLVCQGLSNKAIGSELSIAERTVKAHLSAIFRKLGATNRVQAILLYEKRRIQAPGGGTDSSSP